MTAAIPALGFDDWDGRLERGLFLFLFSFTAHLMYYLSPWEIPQYSGYQHASRGAREQRKGFRLGWEG